MPICPECNKEVLMEDADDDKEKDAMRRGNAPKYVLHAECAKLTTFDMQGGGTGYVPYLAEEIPMFPVFRCKGRDILDW